jgi:zinc transporter
MKNQSSNAAEVLPSFLYHYRLNGDKSALNLANHKVGDLPEGQTLWQHIDLNDHSSVQWLEMHANLDPIVFNALTVAETRPRSFSHKNGLMIVLRGVNMNPGNDTEDMISIRLWIEESRIVTTRVRPVLSVSDIVHDLSESQGPQNIGDFLTSLVGKLADRIGDFVNIIEDELGDAEDSLDELEPNELRNTLGSLRRQIAKVRRYLAPQRDALDRLNSISTKLFAERDRQRLREESDRISRYLEDLDLARERCVVLQEAFLSQMAQQQNTRMYVLSIVAAIFLPLSFLTGLLGMNIGGLPGIENSQAFLLVIIGMITGTVVIAAFFRWKKWI